LQGSDTQDAADDSEGDAEVKPVVNVSRPVTKTKPSTQIKYDTDSESDSDFESDSEGVEESKDEGGDVNDDISITSDDKEYYENIEKQKIYMDKLNEQQKKDYNELSDYEKGIVMYIFDSAKMKNYLGI
jgi:hypothetical protein